MRRIFESCHHPELLTGYDSLHVIGNKIVNLIISHCSDNNIIVMSLSRTAGYDKIQPII